MADTKLTALAAVPTPADNDLVYIVHDPDGTAASGKVTVANLTSQAAQAIPHAGTLTLPQAMEYAAGGVFNVMAYGAYDDDTHPTETTAAIQAAIVAASTPLGATGHGRTRPGRGRVVFPAAGIYAINNTLNMCNLEGVILDGSGGAIIDAHCTGKAAIEMIGSQECGLRDLVIWGDVTDTPTMALWVSRSTTTNGINSYNLYFEHLFVSGYYTKCAYYCLESESNQWEKCVFQLYGGGFDSIIYMATTNDLALTPEHATLSNTNNGNVLHKMHNCHAYCLSANTRALYVRGLGGITLENSFLYGAPDAIMIEMDSGSSLDMSHCDMEGTPAEAIHITYRPAVSANTRLTLDSVGFPSSTAYVIYAENGVILRDSAVRGDCGLGGTFKPMRFNQAEGCDFRGFFRFDWNVFNIIIDGGLAQLCKFHLAGADTISFLNGGALYECDVDDNSGFGGVGSYMKFSGGVKIGEGWAQSHLIMGNYHLWINAYGKLMIKAGFPTSDTDGTVIGTQT